ncbi:hypothetical protein K502DRAFT_349578 [Neoconidiobolus thromboides FSU 785]|nr:hypothetical protein K502DRAFT_349578 [Neoconidiobolus thromboides FSU 785]
MLTVEIIIPLLNHFTIGELIRLRCINKRWNKLILIHLFNNINYKLYTKFHLKTQLQYKKYIQYVCYDKEIEKIKDVEEDQDQFFKYKKKDTVKNNIHGLILVLINDNPTTRTIEWDYTSFNNLKILSLSCKNINFNFKGLKELHYLTTVQLNVLSDNEEDTLSLLNYLNLDNILSFSYFGKANFKLLLFINTYLIHVNRLILENHHQNNTNKQQSLSFDLRQIQYFKAHFYKQSDIKVLNLINGSKLKKLQLYGRIQYKFGSLINLLSISLQNNLLNNTQLISLTQLTNLDINFKNVTATTLNFNSINQLINGNFSTLRILKLININHIHLNCSFNKLHQLNELHIQYNGAINNSLIQFINLACSSILTLYLTLIPTRQTNSIVQNQSTEHTNNLLLKIKLPQLLYLEFNYPFFNTMKLKTFFEKFPKLIRFHSNFLKLMEFITEFDKQIKIGKSMLK